MYLTKHKISALPTGDMLVETLNELQSIESSRRISIRPSSLKSGEGSFFVSTEQSGAYTPPFKLPQSEIASIVPRYNGFFDRVLPIVKNRTAIVESSVIDVPHKKIRTSSIGQVAYLQCKPRGRVETSSMDIVNKPKDRF